MSCSTRPTAPTPRRPGRGAQAPGAAGQRRGCGRRHRPVAGRRAGRHGARPARISRTVGPRRQRAIHARPAVVLAARRRPWATCCISRARLAEGAGAGVSPCAMSIDAFRHALGESGHGKRPDRLRGRHRKSQRRGRRSRRPSSAGRAQAWTDRATWPCSNGCTISTPSRRWPSEDQDHHFGRRRSDNEELEDSPTWAHVKRTAQESFDPPAFMLRRSMPWMMSMQAGLMFVAFGKSH